MIVVSDTSPLLSLIYLQQLRLLPLLFDKVVIPESVKIELLRSKIPDTQKQNLTSLNWMRVESPKDVAGVSRLLLKNLHRAEAEAIIVAKELQADYLLIDEQIGRAIAKSEGLTIVGVLGVLLIAKQQNHIEALKPMLDILSKETGFWVSKKLYEHLLWLAGEESA